jgi:hypothetical protein
MGVPHDLLVGNEGFNRPLTTGNPLLELFG